MKHFCSFSEAIREGAKIRPQGFKTPESRVGQRQQTSCAIEAGIEAIGCDLDWADECALTAMFPYLGEATASPLDGRSVRRYELCWILNDSLWTREQIADWLESEEEKLGFVTLTEEVELPKPELSHTV